jgi:hypothetical protein
MKVPRQTKDYPDDEIKEDEMLGTCSTRGVVENVYIISTRIPERKRTFEKVCADWKIILN